MSSYIGNDFTKTVKVDYKFVASDGQTTFDGLDINGAYLAFDVNVYDVYVNGVMISKNDYSGTGSSITFNEGLSLNDELLVRAFDNYGASSEVSPDQVRFIIGQEVGTSIASNAQGELADTAYQKNNILDFVEWDDINDIPGGGIMYRATAGIPSIAGDYTKFADGTLIVNNNASPIITSDGWTNTPDSSFGKYFKNTTVSHTIEFEDEPGVMLNKSVHFIDGDVSKPMFINVVARKTFMTYRYSTDIDPSTFLTAEDPQLTAYLIGRWK